MKRNFRLTACKQHDKNDHADAPDFCWSCQASIEYNVMHERCECGKPATGYSVTQAGAEFFCNDHYNPGKENVMGIISSCEIDSSLTYAEALSEIERLRYELERARQMVQDAVAGQAQDDRGRAG